MKHILNSLQPEFQEKIEILLKECEKQGIVMRPFFGVRDVYTQSKLWRQSRSIHEIKKAVSFLRRQQADYLADVLEQTEPQIGRWATNALPGESWHQWGEAVDCFVLDQESGKAIWSSKHEGYRVYAEQAKKLGLTSGHYWQNPDSVHVQLREEKVTKIFSWRKINEKLQAV